MPDYCEIRADYNRDSLIVYQAYNHAIADAALKAQKFVEPWSSTRMTWIKPSFLWMMERSNWGSKSNQERILAVRIRREDWDRALASAVLTHSEQPDAESWREQIDSSPVRVQWDPERALSGVKLTHRAIQVGIGRPVCEDFASRWITEIRDLTELVHKMRRARDSGDKRNLQRWLPPERVYPMPKGCPVVSGR